MCIRYYLVECSKRIKASEIFEFKSGDTFTGTDLYDEVIASFESKEEALEALHQRKSFYREDTYVIHDFVVYEYAVEEVYFYDDDDFESAGYIEFSPSPFNVVKP